MSKSIFLEKTFKKIKIYEGKSVNFRADKVILPDGKKAQREFIEHPGAVAVLPINSKGEIIFVRQFRYPVFEETLEIPAGKLHSKKDNPLIRAKEELKEETGFSAKRISHLLDFWPTPAFSDEVLRIYAAYGLNAGKNSPDEDEFISWEAVSPKKALSFIKKGKIKDSKTIIALYHYFLFKK
ncbi:MAG: NUDIX hydrolase [Elusimicrobiota bacterium]